jgi:DNA-binding MarR family transcriptional regulator
MSAWRYEETGQNYVGRHGAFFATNEAVGLITTDQDAFVMLAFLRASNKPDAIFPVANGLSNKLGWRRQRVTAARNRLIAAGYIKRVRNAYTGHVAQYVWVRDKARSITRALRRLGAQRIGWGIYAISAS